MFVDVCLEFVMVKDITIDKVDAEDFCSLLIREWPLAPCTTPHPEYSAMVSVGTSSHVLSGAVNVS